MLKVEFWDAKCVSRLSTIKEDRDVSKGKSASMRLC